MPTKYERKGSCGRGGWTEESLKRAINAVHEKELGINAAARAFGIPKTTLKRRLKSENHSKGPMGPSSILGTENEKKLVAHIKKLQERGFTPCKDSVRSIAFELAESLNISHTFNRETKKAGYDWLQLFLKRNPILTIRKSEGVSVARARGMTKEIVNAYFTLLQKVMADNDLIRKPANVFNMDETGLQLNNKPGLVVAVKGSKNVTSITSGEKGETISVLTCVNGEGTFLPPFCVMKGKNLKQEFTDGMPTGAEVRMSVKSAYVNSEIFLDWLKNHFTPRKPAGKVLLLLDGHTSHTSCLETLEFAEKNEIILMSLPPHTSHWLQPLDRSFFKALKTYYFSACKNFMLNHPSRKINRLQFGKLLCSAWAKAATLENGTKGFMACGIIPLDQNAIPEYAYLAEPNLQQQAENHTQIPADIPNVHNVLQEQHNNTPISRNKQVLQDNLAIPSTSKENFEQQGKHVIPRTLSNSSSASMPTISPKSFYSKITPSKILDQISPVPSIDKINTLKRKSQTVSKVLNSVDSINDIKRKKEEKRLKEQEREIKKEEKRIREQQKQNKKEEKTTNEQEKWNKNEKIDREPGKENKLANVKEKKTQNKKQKMQKHVSDSEESYNTDELVEDEDIDSEAWDENECVGCGESFNQTTRTEDWVQCVLCSRWSHEGCYKFGAKCDRCGKKEKTL